MIDLRVCTMLPDGIGAGLGLLEWGMRIEDEILDKLKTRVCYKKE